MILKGFWGSIIRAGGFIPSLIDRGAFSTIELVVCFFAEAAFDVACMARELPWGLGPSISLNPMIFLGLGP